MEKEERDPSLYNLSETQLKALNEPCPHCGGKLYPVDGNGEDEDECYLWCDSCLLSMDSSGGYTS